MILIHTKTRRYFTAWGVRRVKVWKLGPVVLWRRAIRPRTGGDRTFITPQTIRELTHG